MDRVHVRKQLSYRSQCITKKVTGLNKKNYLSKTVKDNLLSIFNLFIVHNILL